MITRPSDDDWELHRATLERLYSTEGRPMRQVISYMRESHGWDVKRNQYEKWLTTRWRLRKHNSSQAWRELYPHVRDLERTGKSAEVWIGGKRQSTPTIERELKRQLLSCRDLVTEPAHELNGNVVIRERVPFSNLAKMSVLTQDLPFHQFESYLRGTLSIEMPMSERGTSYQDVVLQRVINAASSPECRIEACLHSIMPHEGSEVNAFDSSLARPRTDISRSPIFRHILFSMANNFAGLDNVGLRLAFESLLQVASKELYQIVRSTPQYHTTQAIAKSVFKAAIELAHADIVDTLLKDCSLNIGVNQKLSFPCDPRGWRCSPLRRATDLKHKQVIEVLLAYGAKPEEHSDFSQCSLCDEIMFSYESCSYATDADREVNRIVSGCGYCVRSGSEVRSMLVGADHEVSPDDLHFLMNDSQSQDLFRQIFENRLAKNQHDWRDSRIFSSLFGTYDQDSLLYFLDFMVKNEIDLNATPKISPGVIESLPESHKLKTHYLDVMKEKEIDLCVTPKVSPDFKDHLSRYGASFSHHERCEESLIEKAARRGFFNLTRSLFEAGACITPDTLPNAISSGDKVLTDYLLKHGANPHAGRRSRDSPLIVAIRLQQPEITKLILSAIDPISTYGRDTFLPALEAASEVGDLTLLHTMIGQVNKNMSTDYGRALSTAIIYGQQAAALMLVNAGADVEDVTSDHSPLCGALKLQNHALVCAILDAEPIARYTNSTAHDEPYFSYSGSLDETPPVELVVRWGNVDILQKCIVAGIDINDCGRRSREFAESALFIAVRSKNRLMADILLQNGCFIDIPTSRKSGLTALRAAVESQELQMIDYIFQNGADPHDGGALTKAVEYSSKNMVKRMTQEHAARYPGAHPGWCRDAILNAVDQNDLRIFKILLKADPNPLFIPKNEGLQTSFLHHAIIKANDAVSGPAEGTTFKFLEFLLQNQVDTKCNPEVMTSFHTSYWSYTKSTFFMDVIRTGNSAMVDLLIRYGAKINGPVKRGFNRTPLQVAAENGHVELIRKLLDLGADVNSPAARDDGATALQFAAMKGYISIAFTLLQAGAQVDASGGFIEDIMHLGA
ncbi:uncharacterized protein KY384_004676 [Bacidia gigantensis]|uniref:uncharacterized protein n=1 Tax=Bacidia gigantensis TaxID=2732470 RepID=UPI001D038250|nr:uncharacterized protein KY384_004676 [Bacidia gigantensis]KAG8530638.1 hypothetical protein KY384_004676 [Bacidia gigantensis]